MGLEKKILELAIHIEILIGFYEEFRSHLGFFLLAFKEAFICPRF